MLNALQFDEIEELLRMDYSLANVGIAHSEEHPTKAHPLHRICDGVFEKNYSDEDALHLAKLFLTYGAKVDGLSFEHKQDTPLIAACSLLADRVALHYLSIGADIHHQGCMGGTALHWACWTGRSQVVPELLARHPQLDQLCIDHQATPLFWAVHGFKNTHAGGSHDQIACVELLLNAGADPSIPSGEGLIATQLLDEQDNELLLLLQN